ncbi:PREDICTED: coiled-coil domain-containing protein 87 [Condylura cristata]|uniref:coiled-coil domain-containing protein 87 n=1 Tax=Condylura cristata TaxID=143302 RepID=UPI0003345353|nr:PREDICTED: coiled-coil domain-containing protein 87 [Condylura cristata]
MEPSKPETELQQLYHRLLRPLSLFPRKATVPQAQKRPTEEPPMLLPLPISRLTVESLCRKVAERLESCRLAVRVPHEGRLRFTKVILDELKCSWQEPPSQPTLSHLENQRFWNRLQAHVLLSSEQLFLSYLYQLVTVPNSKGVFTESATLTRLAASLARDCTNFLTSPEVYRCLLTDFLALLKAEQVEGGLHKLRTHRPTGALTLYHIPLPRSSVMAQVLPSSLNLNYLIQLSRPTDAASEPEPDPVKELKSIPQLKKRKTLGWLPSRQTKREKDSSSQMVLQPKHFVAPPTRRAPPSPPRPPCSHLHKGHSMPSLREGWKLADELGLPPLPPRPLTPLILVAESKPELAVDMVAEDLKAMRKKMKLELTHHSSLDSGLPPLVGALTHCPTATDRREELQRMLKSLEEEEAARHRGLQFQPSPTQPQPITVTLKLRNQMVVQAAAVQFSERNFVDSFHVEGAGVLYNHLNGELDPKLIEEMDMDRFVGSSLREVYKELMSRVSNKHFSFDQGPLVESTSETAWSGFQSSAFLGQDKQNRIINPTLVGLYSKKTNVFQPSPEKTASLLSLQAKKTWARKYNKISWLAWWRSTISVDDYFTYLLKQETDFLHVIFQMYEEEVGEEPPAPVKETLKIQPPPPLLQDEDPNFVSGEWNWNTVLEYKVGPQKTQLLGEVPKLGHLQKRLERLWSLLEIPHKDRLDMAIKYSSNARLRQLPSLVSAWESVLKPIHLRESLLAKLEWFERQASNPNRFFEKVDLGPSNFLEENQIRSKLYKKLGLVEAPLVSLLREIESIFGEPVTFKGRRYLDKMKRDKVEMLYWLQQRRRVRHLAQAQKASHPAGLHRRPGSQALVAPGNSPIPL